MKSQGAEVSAIRDIITKLALTYPEVAFKFINQEKVILDLDGCNNVLDRICSIFGNELKECFVEVRFKLDDNISISGFVARTPESRANSKSIYTFVNRRWITHNSIIHSVRRAYDGLLPPRRFPIAFLFIAINPNEIDINVHPTKSDIRFSNEREINGSIFRAVTEALRSENICKNKDNLINERINITTEIPKNFNRNSLLKENHVKYHETKENISRPSITKVNSDEEFAKKPYAQTKIKSILPQQNMLPFNSLDSFKKSDYKILGQSHNSFIIVESKTGVLFIDQHALHERIIFEELLKQRTDISVQRLLVPAVLELSAEEYSIVIENSSHLNDMGFELENFGNRTILIHTMPVLLKTTKAAELLKDCIFELSTGNTSKLDFKAPFIKTIACKAAIKAGDRLPDEMIIGLLMDLEKKSLAFTCPHGRPFAFEIGIDDIKRRFERT